MSEELTDDQRIERWKGYLNRRECVGCLMDADQPGSLILEVLTGRPYRIQEATLVKSCPWPADCTECAEARASDIITDLPLCHYCLQAMANMPQLCDHGKLMPDLEPISIDAYLKAHPELVTSNG